VTAVVDVQSTAVLPQTTKMYETTGLLISTKHSINSHLRTMTAQ